MSTKAERGTKRTCQNPECGSRFYDLNRDPITCPICSTVYELAASPVAAAAAAAAAAERRPRASRPRSRPIAVESAKPEDAPEPRARRRWPQSKARRSRPPADEDETFLEEEEEDGSDMTGIIGGPVAEPDEPQ